MTKKGLFIVVDGPSASGKNSIIKQVLKELNGLGIKALSIEETKEKNYNRKKILEVKKQGDREVVRIIIDERRKLYQTSVVPQLLSGALVIANRGETTTLAYQTINHELTMKNIWNMHRQKQIPFPDLIVITNCTVKEAIRREGSRKKSLEEKDKNWLNSKFTFARKEIHANYELLVDFLKKKGVDVIYLRTDLMSIDGESQKIADFIKNKVNYAHE